MKKILVFIAIVVLASACTPTTSIEGNGTTADAKANAFGAEVKVKKNSVMTYDQLLAKLEKTEKLDNVQVEGRVEAVCQAKGCWMTIVSDDATKQKMMVKFKDYAFFMPLNLSGSTVIMQGNAYIETTPVDELRHYAEDAGKSEEEIAKITEPKVELKFLADGVILKTAS
jgi:hypothetical protein